MGSSIVIIFRFEVALILSTTVASVVDLPEPVIPVTRTRPSRNDESLERLSGRLRPAKELMPSIRSLNAALIAPFW